MKTSEGKIIHLEINRTETLQKCVTDKKKNTQPHQRFKLCKPQKHKTP